MKLVEKLTKWLSKKHKKHTVPLMPISEVQLQKLKQDFSLELESRMDLYAQELSKLCSKDMDFAFLQQLVNAATGPGVIIDVVLKDGTHLTIQRDERKPSKPKMADSYLVRG